MSDQDPADKLLNQGPAADRADYSHGAGASDAEKSAKGLQIAQTRDSAMEQANNWRGSK